MIYTIEMLMEARKALHDLRVGKAVVSVSKDGRQVQFSQTTIADLKQYIGEIEVALGIPSRRCGPARVYL